MRDLSCEAGWIPREFVIAGFRYMHTLETL